MMATRRGLPTYLLLVVATLVVVFFFGLFSPSSSIDSKPPPLQSTAETNPGSVRKSSPAFEKPNRGIKDLHYILPATAPSEEFCRLHLSGLATGYPEPVLVGWDGHGAYNGTESHLFKVSETLVYLQNLPKEADDDLVLLLDAYDIYLQLRPDVMISRYYEALEREDVRLKQRGIYRKDQGGFEVKNTVVFGSDKVCFPAARPSERAGCWAVPRSSLDPLSWGPLTDAPGIVNTRPIYLNSGTIMGPIKHVRDVFAATMESIKTRYDPGFDVRNSDQYYFTNVWAAQELKRAELDDPEALAALKEKHKAIDEMETEGHLGGRTEYHIVMDYEFLLVQAAAGTTETLSWMSFNHSTSDSIALAQEHRLDRYPYPHDLSRSLGPYEQLKRAAKSSKFSLFSSSAVPKLAEWKEQMLGINPITQTVFPILHFTGDKSYRRRWWPRMWFHANGEKIKDANIAQPPYPNEKPGFLAEVAGVKYMSQRTWPGHVKGFPAQGQIHDSRGGAWTDLGGHLTWDDLCKKHEAAIFGYV